MRAVAYQYITPVTQPTENLQIIVWIIMKKVEYQLIVHDVYDFSAV